MERRAFVHTCELVMDRGVDRGAPGAAVTVALCGHWEHEGPCRWPHNTAVRLVAGSLRVRTVFVAAAADEDCVRDLIERALRDTAGWRVVATAPRALRPAETALAERLIAGPDLGAEA